MNKLLTNPTSETIILFMERLSHNRSVSSGAIGAVIFRLPVLALGMAMTFAGTSAAAVVNIGDVRFAAQAAAGASQLEIIGAGVLRYRGLIRAYAAALYAAPGISPEHVLEDIPKRLEIEYFWKLDAEDFGRAAIEMLERTQGPAQLAALRDRLTYLNSRYEDIEPGDRYALTYFPGVGTELSKNGRTLGVVPGADFAAAYFAMWLGDRPIDADLRDSLRTRISERAQN